MNVPRAVCSVGALLSAIHGLVRENGTLKEHAHVRFWFRGHADAQWKLHPGVYRQPFESNFPKEDKKNLGRCESRRLINERHLYQDFRIMSASMLTGREADVDLYLLQQHYGMPTRLLDWSNSALAALFFIVNDADKLQVDGALFMMDVYQLSIHQGAVYRNKIFRGIADTHNSVFRDSLRPITGWDDSLHFPDFIIPVRPNLIDRRMTLQRSCFTFHVSKRPELTTVENPTLTQFVVPAAAKRQIREELMLLGIDSFAVYGDMDHLTRTLKSSYRVG